jgi:hypothetical protein
MNNNTEEPNYNDNDDRCVDCGKTRKQDIEDQYKAIIEKVKQLLELFTAAADSHDKGIIEAEEEDIQEFKQHLYSISQDGICIKCGDRLYQGSPYYEGLYEPYLDVCWNCIRVLEKGNKNIQKMIPAEWRELKRIKEEDKEFEAEIAAKYGS